MAARRGYLKAQMPDSCREPVKTYLMKAQCTNCGQTNTYDVPFGILAVRHFAKAHCLTCGCRGVLLQVKPEGDLGG